VARKKAGNPHERQATLSVAFAATGALFTMATVALLVRNLDMENFWVAYNPRSKYLPILAVSLMLSVAGGGVGALLGFNSAGQKRNNKSGLSWAGFFSGAGVVTVALCCGVFFYLTKFAVAG
jgi:hypothetical protein